MMTPKHNKKRNTIFLYEILIREATRAIINKESKKKDFIFILIKERFGPETELKKELNLYKALFETKKLSIRAGEKLIKEVKRGHLEISRQKLFEEQSALIKIINKHLSKETFSVFIPNYKNMATISQLFGEKKSAKVQIMLEELILSRLVKKPHDINENKDFKPVTNLIYKTFIKKFNNTYGELLEEQKELFKNYILSFSDSGIGLKVYLNEEISRLKNKLKESLKAKEVMEDLHMFENTKKVLDVIESYKEKKLDNEMLKSILKIQNLVYEIEQ